MKSLGDYKEFLPLFLTRSLTHSVILTHTHTHNAGSSGQQQGGDRVQSDRDQEPVGINGR